MASCLLALLLAACATVAVEQGQIANVRRVAVISALGDQFSVKKMGVMIGNMPAWSVGQSLSAMTAVHGPNREVDPSLRPTTLDAGANPKLREVVLDLLAQNLPGTLQSLKILE